MGATRRPALLLGATRPFPASGRKFFFEWIIFVDQSPHAQAINCFVERVCEPCSQCEKNGFSTPATKQQRLLLAQNAAVSDANVAWGNTRPSNSAGDTRVERPG